MMDGKKVGVVALLIIAAVAVLWYRADVYATRDGGLVRTGPPPKLVLVTGGSGPFWQAIVSGAEQAAEDQGAELKVMMPEGEENVSQQSDLIAEINPKNVDGVAVSPLDADKQTRLIDRIGQHAKVVTVDSDAPFSQRLNYVGASNVEAGNHVGELLQEDLPEGGKVIVLMANETKQNMLDRKMGLEQTLENGNGEPKIEIIDYLVDEGDLDRCRAQLTEAIGANSDLKGIVGLNGYHGAIIADVVKQKNLSGKVVVISFDVDDSILDAIADGTINATIAQNTYQYGYEAISSLCSFCNRNEGQLPLPGAYATTNIRTMIVKKDGVDEHREQLSRYTGETESVKSDEKAAEADKPTADKKNADQAAAGKKAAEEKAAAMKKAEAEKAEAEKAAKEKAAKEKAAKEKAAAEKAAAEKQAAMKKAEAEKAAKEKAAKEKAAAEKAAAEKEAAMKKAEAEKAAKEKAAKEKAAEEKAEAEKEEARKKAETEKSEADKAESGKEASDDKADDKAVEEAPEPAAAD